jgi:hypothetical protein
MAESGIKRYDEIPASVNWCDVDYIRWRLSLCLNPPWYSKIPLFGWMLIPTSDNDTKKLLIKMLEDARRAWRKKKITN